MSAFRCKTYTHLLDVISTQMVLTFIQIFLIFTHVYLDVFANTLRFTYVP